MVVVLLAAAIAGWLIFVESSRPDEPGEFYSAPAPLPDGPPGTIIRSEVVDDFVAGATTYRVLYTSTGYDGEPTAVSGLILVPDDTPPDGGRKVVAYTHGTTGVASRCAPSLVTNPEQQPVLVEGGPELLAAGYVVAATDYQGLGTPGPHPYLVGDSEAMNALDSVRAARNLDEADASDDFAGLGSLPGRSRIAVHWPARFRLRARASTCRRRSWSPGSESRGALRVPTSRPQSAAS